jgi:hypothetical protein
LFIRHKNATVPAIAPIPVNRIQVIFHNHDLVAPGAAMLRISHCDTVAVAADNLPQG